MIIPCGRRRMSLVLRWPLLSTYNNRLFGGSYVLTPWTGRCTLQLVTTSMIKERYLICMLEVWTLTLYIYYYNAVQISESRITNIHFHRCDFFHEFPLLHARFPLRPPIYRSPFGFTLPFLPFWVLRLDISGPNQRCCTGAPTVVFTIYKPLPFVRKLMYQKRRLGNLIYYKRGLELSCGSKPIYHWLG